MAIEDFPEIRPKPSEEDRRTSSRREYYMQLNDWCDAAVEEGRLERAELRLKASGGGQRLKPGG